MSTPTHEQLLASLTRQIAQAEQDLALAEATVIRARTVRDELRGARHMLTQIHKPIEPPTITTSDDPPVMEVAEPVPTTSAPDLAHDPGRC